METFNKTPEDVNDIISAISNTKLDDDSCVSFAGCGIKLDLPEDAQPIVEAVGSCQNLVTLNLEGNTLGCEAAKEIGKSLEGKSTLKNLLLKDLFTGRLKTEIPEAIKDLSSGVIKASAQLSVLDLSDNALGPIGMTTVLPFLQSEPCKSLQVLKLNNNGLGVGGGRLLAQALKDLKQLKVFVCGRNRLENDGSTEIGKSLANLSSLEVLEMPQNGIQLKGMTAIAKAIESNSNLKVLNLNDNNLKGPSGRVIAEALSQLMHVEVVNFGDCLLKSSGCVAVCEALICTGNVSKMKEIILNGNEIGGPKAVEALDRLFGDSEHYQVKIDLSNNNFGNEGVEQLTQLLGSRLNLLLNDDEGTEDEDENSDEETENDNEEEEGDENDTLNKSNTSNKENEPTVESLTDAFQNDDLNSLCDEFVKISIDGFESESLKLKDDSLNKSAACLSAILKKSDDYMAMNQLLISLGLLKGEDGKYKVVSDLRGPLVALTHSMDKLTSAQKHVLRAFMNRPDRSTEVDRKVKHQLMQALYV